jgi:2',3'-cyclic-nucleotide 2'-phosphodiesterase (5'-nucleotidase family)
MITRRGFLKASMAGGAVVMSPRSALKLLSTPWSAISAPLLNVARGEKLITILHTNDTHSQIDPLPANDGQYPNMGGVARRATLVKRVRKENPNTLMIDAGDVFQGTPYFNFYKGEVEYKSM